MGDYMVPYHELLAQISVLFKLGILRTISFSLSLKDQVNGTTNIKWAVINFPETF